jgi:hypothetical protein
MISTLFKVVSELMEITWLLLIAALVLVTFPVWFIPYTAYKFWKALKS